VVDRLPRRSVILGTDFLSGCAVGVLAVLGALGSLRIEAIYVLSAFLGAAAALYLPGMSAIMPELVPKEVLVPGNALRAMSRQGSRVIGPAVGGLLVTGTSPSTAFAVDAATFFVSFGIFLASRSPSRTARQGSSLLGELTHGLRFTFSINWIFTTILTFGIINLFFLGSLTVGLPLLVRDVLRGGASTFGVITAAGGVGEMLALVGVGAFAVRRPGVVMYFALLTSALSLSIFGLIPVIVAIVVAQAIFAAGLVATNTLWESALQARVPGNLIGRVSSVDWFGSLLIGAPAPLLAGLVLATTNPRVLFVISGLSAALIAFIVGRLPFIRELSQGRSP
jgi:MFS transporter, DHA3 family, tetracycline resistance protein